MPWMPQWNRRLALLGGAGLAIAGGFALKGGAASRSRAQPGTFYFANAAEPFTLDPNLADSSWENYIIGDLMMGLTTEDTMARPVPGIAERWETSPDGLTWTFHLRDALWSDGAPVTADDFIFAWRRVLDPKLAASNAYFPYIIKNGEKINAGHLPGTALGAAAPDPRTLVITLEHPVPYLTEILMHYSMMPVPRHVV
jgi:oligopeptide transport system substrate-binding protein